MLNNNNKIKIYYHYYYFFHFLVWYFTSYYFIHRWSILLLICNMLICIFIQNWFGMIDYNICLYNVVVESIYSFLLYFVCSIIPITDICVGECGSSNSSVLTWFNFLFLFKTDQKTADTVKSEKRKKEK